MGTVHMNRIFSIRPTLNVTMTASRAKTNVKTLVAVNPNGAAKQWSRLRPGRVQ